MTRFLTRMRPLCAAALLLLWGLSLTAVAADDVAKCEAARLKSLAVYARCGLAAAAVNSLNLDAEQLVASLQRCEASLTKSYRGSLTRYGPACPTGDDLNAVKFMVDGFGIRLATWIQGNLGTRFTDNGNGTATDNLTGLVWQMKTGTPGAGVTCLDEIACPDPHAVNNRYTWTVTGTDPDGSAYGVLLAQLNDVAGGGAACFADSCNWRLPTVAELEAILDLYHPGCGPEPALACTTIPGVAASTDHWSADTSPVPADGIAIGFDVGDQFPVNKSVALAVRAVRSPF